MNMKPRERRVVRVVMVGWILLGVLSLQAVTGNAEPGRAVVVYLTSTPVSLMSFGLYQLNAALKQLSDEPEWHSMAFYSGYDWDKNRIVISAVGDGVGSKDKCAELVNYIRRDGGIAPGGTYVYGDNSLYAEFFGPTGFDYPSAPKGYKKKVDEIIVISVENESKKIKCGGDLLATEVLFQEQ
jgi:hypothetical protein